MYHIAVKVASLLKKENIQATLINPLFISSIDKELLTQLQTNHHLVCTIEDGILASGFGEKIAGFYAPTTMRVLNFGLEKNFYDRYDYEELAKTNHLTPQQIAQDTLQLLHTLQNKNS